MSRLLRIALASGVAFAAAVPGAHAQTSVLVSNQVGSGPTLTYQPSLGQWSAQQFNTGPSAVTIANWQWDVGQPQGGAMTSYIASDVNGSPGANLMGSAVQGVPTAQQNYTFYPVSGSTNLAANTNYWLVLVPQNQLTYNVQYWNPGVATTGPGSLGKMFYSNNYGANWIDNGPTDFQVAINTVAAVPEPTSLAMMGLGGLVLGAGVWRRKRSESAAAAAAAA